MKKRIVIIGGCAAGPKTAAKSRRMDKNTQIDLYTQLDIVSYSACGMPYYIGGQVSDIKKLIIRTPEEFKKNDINIHLKRKCEKILPKKKQVIIDGERIKYDELVLAVGAKAKIPSIKNVFLRNVFTMRTLYDGLKIKEAIQYAKSVVIVGFGYIGLEMVEAFLRNNLKVYIIENNNYPMSLFDDEIGYEIQQYIEEKNKDNVEIITGDIAAEFIGTTNFEGVKTFKGKEIRADFCLICTGVTPNVELAREAGIEIGTTGAIKVDKKMRTNIKNIWAVGDCAEKYCLITNLPTYAALGSVANKEGRICAINLNGGCEEFLGVLGSSVTQYFDFTMSITGLSEKAIKKIQGNRNLDYITSTITKLDKAIYMPNASPITIKLIADKKTGKLLGAQGAGIGDVDKRINVVTSALQKGMTLNEFIHLDLTYTPTTSGAIDPLLTVSYNLKDKFNIQNQNPNQG